MDFKQFLSKITNWCVQHPRVFYPVAVFSFLELLTRLYYPAPKKVLFIRGLGKWYIPRLLSELYTLYCYQRDLPKFLDITLNVYEDNNVDTFTVKFTHTPWAVLTRDPRNIKHILNDAQFKYPKSTKSQLFDLLGDGIFASDGLLWKMQRKNSAPLFSHASFKKHMCHVFHDKLTFLCNKLNTGSTYDFFNVFNRLTLDSIGKVGFGAELECIDGIRPMIVSNLSDLPSKDETIKSHPFLHAFDRGQYLIEKRFTLPAWFWRKISRIDPIERELSLHIKHLREFATCVATRRLAELRSSNIEENGATDFLSLFMKAHAMKTDDDGVSTSASCLVPDETTHRDIDFWADVVLNFLIAGRDTTAQTLSWCLYELCLHPEYAQAVKNESMNTFPHISPWNETSSFSFLETSNIPMIAAVISETLRLHPPVPRDLKIAACHDQWPTGVTVPKGSWIEYDIYSMGRSTKVFGKDAGIFNPDRWISGADTVFRKSGDILSSVDQYVLPVFNAGPRICLGRLMAMLELKMSLIFLFDKFNFDFLNRKCRDVISYSDSITLAMQPGLYLKVTS